MKVNFYFHSEKVIIEAEISEVLDYSFSKTDRGIKEEFSSKLELSEINEVQCMVTDNLLSVTENHKNLILSELDYIDELTSDIDIN